MIEQMLIGIWDVQGGGMQSEVLFNADHTYVNTLAGGMQQHWGTWSIMQNGGIYFIVFQIKGAQPQSFVGPLGTVPIQWPTSETWTITNIEPNHISIYGGELYRRGAVPTYAPGYGPTMTPAMTPTMSPEAMQALREASEAATKAIQEVTDNARAAHEKANKAWSDYLRS